MITRFKRFLKDLFCPYDYAQECDVVWTDETLGGTQRVFLSASILEDKNAWRGDAPWRKDFISLKHTGFGGVNPEKMVCYVAATYGRIRIDSKAAVERRNKAIVSLIWYSLCAGWLYGSLRWLLELYRASH